MILFLFIVLLWRMAEFSMPQCILFPGHVLSVVPPSPWSSLFGRKVVVNRKLSVAATKRSLSTTSQSREMAKRLQSGASASNIQAVTLSETSLIVYQFAGRYLVQFVPCIL
jgi:hypothetical protein